MYSYAVILNRTVHASPFLRPITILIMGSEREKRNEVSFSFYSKQSK